MQAASSFRTSAQGAAAVLRDGKANGEHMGLQRTFPVIQQHCKVYFLNYTSSPLAVKSDAHIFHPKVQKSWVQLVHKFFWLIGYFLRGGGLRPLPAAHRNAKTHGAQPDELERQEDWMCQTATDDSAGGGHEVGCGHGD
jgi:hypothetical protein